MKTKVSVTLEEYSKAYHEHCALCEADAKFVPIIDGDWVCRSEPSIRTFDVGINLIDAIDEIVTLQHRVAQLERRVQCLCQKEEDEDNV